MIDQDTVGAREISPDEGVRFLAEAGEALAASLEWEETLVQVARLAVPALADWAFAFDHAIASRLDGLPQQAA